MTTNVTKLLSGLAAGASAADKLMFSGAILLLAAAMDAVSRQGANFSRGGGGT